MTYTDAVRFLTDAGIENASADAAILFEHFAGIPRHELPFRRNEDITSAAFLEALKRRISREPLQYILGEWEFCGLAFSLNRDCLCPRPDTELIVELALKNLPPWAHFCDIGTGSGAIAVSILHYRPDTTADAYDISEGALCAARKNAERNMVADRFSAIKADALSDDFLTDCEKYDAVISNPPYIPASVIPTLAPEVLLEPHRALDGGEDGLDFYRAIICKSQLALKPGGFVLFEVGSDQAQAVASIGYTHGFSPELYPDLSGIMRAVLLKTT